jgi:hypothetical protein
VNHMLCLIQDNAVDLQSMCNGLLVRNNGPSAFPSAEHCQDQLQIPPSVTATTYTKFHIHNIVGVLH